MDQSTGDVQQNRERTRAAITEKIELLEESVRDRVEGAKTAVKQSFDFRYQVNRRPWQVFGFSVVAGYFLGRMMSGRDSNWKGGDYGSRYWRRRPEAAQEIGIGETSAATSSVGDEVYSPSVGQRQPKRSWAVLDQFQDEIAALKGAAIAAVVSVVRDLLKSAATSVQDTARSLTDERRSGTERGHTGIH